MTTPQIDALIEATRQIARREILTSFRALDPADIDTKTDAQDLVTKADRAAEAALTAAAEQIFPGALVIGEEAVSEGRVSLDALKDCDQAVIIDPIDGTWNYANGLGIFGVIIAVVERGETVFGMLYDPLGDDWVAALAGSGAEFTSAGGVTSLVRAAPAPASLYDMIGAWPLYLFEPNTRKRLAALMPDFARVLSIRCSCHEYRLLAQGQMHFCLSGSLKPWDHAAGALILREAGGYVKLLDGTSYRPLINSGHLLCAPDRDSWGALADVLRGAIY